LLDFDVAHQCGDEREENYFSRAALRLVFRLSPLISTFRRHSCRRWRESQEMFAPKGLELKSLSALAANDLVGDDPGTTDMISAALLRRYSAQPRAFTLHLADGRKIRVPHGDHISVQPEGGVFLLW
jgi:hypothetical protein